MRHLGGLGAVTERIDYGEEGNAADDAKDRHVPAQALPHLRQPQMVCGNLNQDEETYGYSFFSMGA